MNSILLFMAGLLVLALSTLFAAPYFVDWNDYRDVFEAQATKLAGRKVDVGGDVSLTLLPAPVVRFETINVADAKGDFDTPFASAKSFTMWLSVPPLLRGTIEARSVEITQPVLNLRIAKDGTGNWSDMGGEAADLPFLPRDVALNSVEISGATINIWRDNPEPDSVIEQLDGELSSRSLQGPYKFAGGYTWQGVRRDVRFSTGKPDENGEFRLKTSLREPDTKETYSIDGVVRGFGDVPVFKGTFQGRLADDGESSEVVGDKDKEKDKTAQAASPYEIDAELYLAFMGAEFNNVELRITKNDKPQTVRGLMDVRFQKGLKVGGTFSSRWVDLDSWIESGSDSPPELGSALSDLAKEVSRRVSGIREGSFKLFLDQAVIAGDLTTNVQLDITTSEGKLEITNLSARLPGENKLKLEGTVASEEGASVFKGPVTVSGESLSRLLRWANVSDDPGAATQAADFSLKGELTAGGERLLFEQAEGSLFGSAFTGSFAYRGGAERDMSVTLNSERMDLARVFGSNASAKSLWALLAPGAAGADGADAGKQATPGSWLGNVNAEADINIGAVSFAGLGESSLDAKLTLSQGALDIRRLKLASGSDVILQAGGRLTGLGDKPKGNVTLAVQADTGKGLASLGEFLELPNIAGSPTDRLEAMTPVQITAAVRSSETATVGLDVQIEGSLGKSDLLVKLDLDGPPSDWAGNAISLQGSLSNGSGKQLIQQVRPGLKDADLAVFSDGEGRLSLEATGFPSAGLKSSVALKAGGANWTAQGTYTIADSGNKFSGTTNLMANSTAAALTLIGMKVAPGHGSNLANISAKVESAGGIHKLRNFHGELGGQSFAGEAEVSTAGERPVISAQFTSGSASLPHILAPMIAWNRDVAGSQEIRGVTSAGAYWPEAPFRTGFLKRADGTLSLESQELHLTQGLGLEQAKLDAELTGGALKVTSLEGGFYGGRLKASGVLMTRGSGVALDAQAKVDGMRLDRIVVNSDGSALVDAPADLTLSLKGEGLTPRGLASGLSGNGIMELGAGTLHGFSLGAAHQAASAAQADKKQGGVDEETLGRRVADSLKSSEMSFSPIRAPFSVRNGVVEFDKLALSDAEGRVTIASYLQLSNLVMDSEWTLQSAENAGKGAKPRVSLVFSGPVKEIGRIRPKIDTAGLARYVAIRNMEKDVERLEKLDVSGSAPGTKPRKPEVEKTAQAPNDTPAPKKPDVKKAEKPKPAPPLPTRKQVPAQAQATAPPPVAAPVPQPDRKPAPATAPPPAPPAAATQPPAAQPPAAAMEPPAAATPAPAASPPPVAAPLPPGAPPQVAAVPAAPAAAAKPAPLPIRKPPVPRVKRPAPATAPKPPPTASRPVAPSQPELPWLKKQPAPAPAPASQPAPPPAQGPTQLPVPGAAANSGTAPPPGITPDTPPAAPPQRPAKKFDPFAGPPN